MPTPLTDAVMALHHAPDGHGFRPTEVQAGAFYAGLIEMGVGLNDTQLRSVARKLDSYRDRLTDLGITTLEAPPAQETTAAAAAVAKATVKVGLVRSATKERILTDTPYAFSDRMRDIDGAEFHSPKRCTSCQARNGNCMYRGIAGWHYPVSPAAAAAIRTATAGEVIANDAAYAELLRLADTSADAGRLRSVDDLPDVPHLKTRAWNHQKQAYWFAIAQVGVQLDMEMGTGKSLTAVALIAAKAADATKAGNRFRAIILCPPRVIGVWPKQFRIHAEQDFHVVDGRRQNRNGTHVLKKIADRVDDFEEAINECLCGRPHVVMANYELCGHEPFKSWALRQDWDVMVLDESHKTKNPQGVVGKYVAKLGARSKFRMGLTGTFMPHSPMDAFSQMRAIDPGVFGQVEGKFKHKYMEMGGFQGKEVKGLLVHMEQEFAKAISSRTYRVGAEVLDLPKSVPDVDHLCDLSPEQAKVYAQIESAMFAEIVQEVEGGATIEAAITADNVLVKMLRLQQITGGAVKTDETFEADELGTEDDALASIGGAKSGGETIVFKAQPKADLLADLLEGIPATEPVVVFCRFHNDLDQVRAVAERMGRTYGELSGRRSDALTADATLAEGVQIAGVQTASGGTGVDLTRSHYCVYYSLSHSFGDYSQSRKRLDRPGQLHPVRTMHLVADGTIDQAIYAALEARESVAKHVGALIRARQEMK